MQFTLFKLGVDVYFDQAAGTGKHHWNKSNDLIRKNVVWSKSLLDAEVRTMHMNLPSISEGDLRELGVVVRCADFVLESMHVASAGKVSSPPSSSSSPSSPPSSSKSLPIFTSDKKTFKIPEDSENPALQVGLTVYRYPERCSEKFLCECDDMYVHIHVAIQWRNLSIVDTKKMREVSLFQRCPFKRGSNIDCSFASISFPPSLPPSLPPSSTPSQCVPVHESSAPQCAAGELSVADGVPPWCGADRQR